MTPIEARFYDGKSSRQYPVLIHPLPPDHLRVMGEGIAFTCALTEVRVSSRVGNTPRHLSFADGSQCETADNDAVDALFSQVRAGAMSRRLHHWETRMAYVALALVLAVAVLWSVIVYGIPAAARQIAFHLPAATDRMLGQEALEALDRALLQPSALAPARQAEVRALFARMAATIPGAAAYRFELRASRSIGPNALALPSGIIVVTDALVELAEKDDELVAVLAHELGHLQQRHGLRRILQGSATVLVTVMLTGDISSVLSMGTALPAVLMESRYSRDFEREADDFAFAYLKQRAIPAGALTDILVRMEKKRGGSGGFPDYVSSHPPVHERAERAREAR